MNDLFNGADVFLGVDAALGPGAGADIIFGGLGSTGKHIFGIELSANLGTAVSPAFPVAPVEVHGGASATILGPFWQVNVYDIFGLLRPSFR